MRPNFGDVANMDELIQDRRNSPPTDRRSRRLGFIPKTKPLWVVADSSCLMIEIVISISSISQQHEEIILSSPSVCLFGGNCHANLVAYGFHGTLRKCRSLGRNLFARSLRN